LELDISNVLFIDTESDPVTKEPQCLQWLMGDQYDIIEDFNLSNYNIIREMWSKASSVVMFNAPYDLGVLSIMFPKNNFQWVIKRHSSISTEKTASWDINVFGNRYAVRKISFFRNLIKPMRRVYKQPDEIDLNKQRRTSSLHQSTPVVDLLKLWSILIDDSDISLKSLIKKELNKTPIKYSPEAAKTKEYRLQDVICLKELMVKFFIYISDLQGLENYTWDDWGYIKTPATFTKIAYKEFYPNLPDWNKQNDKLVEAHFLNSALENAFHGGITLSFYRGKLENTAWVDISGAYSKAIQVINTDSYLNFSINKVKLPLKELKTNIIVKAKVNFIFKTVDKSLKLFKLKTPTLMWVWSDDIKACYNLYPQFKYEVIEAYEFIPLVDVETSLPTEWDKAKQLEKKEHGKTARYRFHKFRSNTGYGITAQRTPFKTVHTNMVIAGMITSKVHDILTTIIKSIEDLGYKNVYNDTDSSCLSQGEPFTEEDMNKIVGVIDENISPFIVESEGYNKNTHILSLKRYISERGEGKNKIRLHGKGRYNIKEMDIYEYVVNHKTPDKELKVSQLAANTKIGMGSLIKLFPYITPFKHPFMFEKNIRVDNKNMGSFMHEWYYHIDTKTSFKKDDDNFYREFHTFKNIHKALRYFRAFIIPKKTEYTNMDYRDWDAEIKEDFNL